MDICKTWMEDGSQPRIDLEFLALSFDIVR